MEGIDGSVTVPSYVVAVKSKSKSFSEQIPLYVDDVVDFILFLILSIGVWIKTIKDLFNPKSPKNISGQLALVTGGGHGLGREIAIRLAKEGCNIAIADLDIIAATETATIIKAFKVDSKAFTCDVSKYDEVKNLARNIEKDMGPVDILINNAGIMPKFSLLEGTSSDLENIINVNIKSHLWTVRVFLESMIRRNKGHIVGISSLAGITGLGRAITYTATKYAVRGFMEALSDELRLDKYDYINLSTVYPTYLSTRQDLMEVISKTERFKRSAVTTPEHAANVIVEGILVNKKSITVPKGASCFIGFLSMLPAEITHLYRDVFQKSNLPRIEV